SPAASTRETAKADAKKPYRRTATTTSTTRPASAAAWTSTERDHQAAPLRRQAENWCGRRSAPRLGWTHRDDAVPSMRALAVEPEQTGREHQHRCQQAAHLADHGGRTEAAHGEVHRAHQRQIAEGRRHAAKDHGSTGLAHGRQRAAHSLANVALNHV